MDSSDSLAEADIETVSAVPSKLAAPFESVELSAMVPAVLTEPLAGILEQVGLLELVALLAGPFGPVELVGVLAGMVQLTELSVGILVELIELAVTAGHPYSRHQVDRFA